MVALRSRIHPSAHCKCPFWVTPLVVLVLWGHALPVVAQTGPADPAPAPDSMFVAPPRIMRNPIRRVPLVAIIDFQSRVPVVTTLLFDDGSRQWEKQVETEPATAHRLPALGMRPARKHLIRVRIENPETGAVETSEPLTFSTPALPRNFPPLKTVLAKPEQMEPGVTLFPTNLWNKNKSVMTYGFLVALDAEGEVVWFLNSGHRTADCRVMRNGHLLFQHASYRHALEIDLYGNVIRQWHGARLTQASNPKSIPVDVDTMHHDLQELPNGNFLTLATQLIHFDKYPTSETDPDAPWGPAYVVVDEIVEFQPDDGLVLRRWPLLKLLDKDRFGYMALTGFWKSKYNRRINGLSRDWSHANALIYVEEDDAMIVSLRHLDCLIKIDRKTGEIVWILGDHGGWGDRWKPYLLEPEGDLEWTYHQHSPQLTRDGTLIIYDNGNYRARPFDPRLPGDQNQSRVVEFRVNEQARTVSQIWEYRGTPDDRFYCPFYSEADLLPETGNILVTDGGHIETKDGVPVDEVPGERQWARVFEITRTDPPEKVFEVTCDSGRRSPFGWSIYRSMRLNDLYDLTLETDLLPLTGQKVPDLQPLEDEP